MGHRSSEKFCLRWNDFESNISIAFRELREEQDFFDVTLACDDEEHVEAHRVILSACSPFFRSVLRRVGKHAPHPLLYLKGVKHADLISVLNFMYHGEVNVAQEELNSFLAVAEELKVKGLTQQNGGQTDSRSSGGGGSSGEGGSSNGGGSLPAGRVRSREHPAGGGLVVSDRGGSSDGGPAAKRSRTVSSALPATAPSSAALVNSKTESNVGGGGYMDDDIQEVIPVKSEPLMAASDHAIVAQPSAMADDYSGGGGGGGQLVSEDYGEDYGDYEGGGGYDGDGSYEGSGLDSSLNVGGGGASADGNKGWLESLLRGYMERIPAEAGGGGPGHWQCRACAKTYPLHRSSNLKDHIEANHLEDLALPCGYCHKTLSTRASLRMHIKNKHPAVIGGGDTPAF